MIDFGWIPETPEDKLEFRKQTIANATDYTKGLAKRITGLCWYNINKICEDEGI